VGLLHTVRQVHSIESVALLIRLIDSTIILLLLWELYQVFLLYVEVSLRVVIVGRWIEVVEDHSAEVAIRSISIILDVLVEHGGGAKFLRKRFLLNRVLIELM